MYCTPIKPHKARHHHRCTYCGEPINPGDSYITWASVEDSWFTNKMHPECLSDFVQIEDERYFPYCNDRPKKEPKS